MAPIDVEARLHEARWSAAAAIRHMRANYDGRDRTPREAAAVQAMMVVEGAVVSALQALELARVGEVLTHEEEQRGLLVDMRRTLRAVDVGRAEGVEPRKTLRILEASK